MWEGGRGRGRERAGCGEEGEASEWTEGLWWSWEDVGVERQRVEIPSGKGECWGPVLGGRGVVSMNLGGGGRAVAPRWLALVRACAMTTSQLELRLRKWEMEAPAVGVYMLGAP